MWRLCSHLCDQMQHSWVKHSVCKPHSAEASKRGKKIKKDRNTGWVTYPWLYRKLNYNSVHWCKPVRKEKLCIRYFSFWFPKFHRILKIENWKESTNTWLQQQLMQKKGHKIWKKEMKGIWRIWREKGKERNFVIILWYQTKKLKSKSKVI